MLKSSAYFSCIYIGVNRIILPPNCLLLLDPSSHARKELAFFVAWNIIDSKVT